jgi:uncharacterized protein (DUF1800 family)
MDRGKATHLTLRTATWRIAASPVLAAPLLLTLLTISGCGFAFGPGAEKIALISGPANTLRVTQSIHLTTLDPVSWSVNGIPGGNSDIGTIDANGNYTAPAIVPLPNNQVTISSVSTVYPKATGSYTVSVLNPIPIVNSVTPSTFSEGSAVITVNGSAFVYGAQIIWNGAPVPTIYISGTQLAAQVSGPTPGSYSVSVQNPDPGTAASGNLAEVVGPGQVVIVLTARENAVRVGGTQRFTAMVTGTLNTAVTWSVNGVAGGNPVVGTIDNNGVYTPPGTVTTASSLTTISATSVDNPAISAQLTIQVFNPVPTLLSGTPPNFDPTQPATFVLNGVNFISGAQILLNGAPIPTSFNSSGQVTAVLGANAVAAGPLDLQVQNPDPGSANSNDLVVQANGTPPTLVPSPEDAARFLNQASFGPTDSDIHHLSTIGYQAWLNEQFALPPTSHSQFVEQQVVLANPPCAASDAICNDKLFLGKFGDSYVDQSFWKQAMTGQDQLRQRIKLALSEIYVISSADGVVQNMPRGIANYYDTLGADAFGNYRQLLQDVTLNPMMGIFLSTMANDKGDANRDPDENYAREVMQLFTIGLYQLNPDGTRELDGNGQPIPTYSNVDVVGLAKVFTGFSWNVPGEGDDKAWDGSAPYAGPGFGRDLLPMQIYPDHHSTLEKDFLGATIPASASPDPSGDLNIALNTLFNHPNAAPFFCKQLIQHLVTSNPSPAYVNRVANIFIDNGSGVRGDMKAIITAILMDDEARNDADITNPQYGKLREPTVRLTHWARAFNAESQSGLYDLGELADPIWGVEEQTLNSPTVFNWFAPGFTPPGTSIEQAGLLAPEMQITDESSVVGYLNFLLNAVIGNNQDLAATYPAEVALAATPDQLIGRLNLLLMDGRMSSALQAQITAAVASIAIPAGDQNAINAALLSRTQLAIYLTMASPDYLAQR